MWYAVISMKSRENQLPIVKFPLKLTGFRCKRKIFDSHNTKSIKDLWNIDGLINLVVVLYVLNIFNKVFMRRKRKRRKLFFPISWLICKNNFPKKLEIIEFIGNFKHFQVRKPTSSYLKCLQRHLSVSYNMTGSNTVLVGIQPPQGTHLPTINETIQAYSVELRILDKKQSPTDKKCLSNFADGTPI